MQPAAGVGERPFFLGEARRRQLEHLGLDLAGSTSLNSPWFSQNRRFGVERIDGDQELQLRERRRVFALLGTAISGLKPWQT